MEFSITDKNGKVKNLEHWLKYVQKHYPAGAMTRCWLSKGKKPYKETGRWQGQGKQR